VAVPPALGIPAAAWRLRADGLPGRRHPPRCASGAWQSPVGTM